jgi:hypothetical protein
MHVSGIRFLFLLIIKKILKSLRFVVDFGVVALLNMPCIIFLIRIVI